MFTKLDGEMVKAESFDKSPKERREKRGDIHKGMCGSWKRGHNRGEAEQRSLEIFANTVFDARIYDVLMHVSPVGPFLS